MPTVDYKQGLRKRLTSRAYAAGYLNAALDEGENVFLLAVRDVVDARGGVAALAEKTGLNRVTLYRLLSDKGNPTLSSLSLILCALGMRMQCCPTRRKQPRAA